MLVLCPLSHIVLLLKLSHWFSIIEETGPNKRIHAVCILYVYLYRALGPDFLVCSLGLGTISENIPLQERPARQTCAGTRGLEKRVCPPMTFPHAPHFHFWDVLMAFDILFIFIFQRNSAKPKDDRKDRLQHPGPGTGSQLLESNLSGPNLKPFHPEEAGKSRRSRSCGRLAKGGLWCTHPQGPPLLAEVKLFLHLC